MIDSNNLVVYGGATLLGAVAGLVGSFSVLRRRALTGDALAHATFPGLCLAFLVLGDRNLPALLVGALCAGLLGVAVISALRRWTRIREDAAICIVLGVFFGAGIALSRLIENASSIGGKAGLDSFILGNTAGITRGEISLLAALAGLCLLIVLLLYKEFKLTVFDSSFGRAQGWPVPKLDFLLMALAAMAVTIGLSAVGVVLMAALLILPAASARLWTDRFGKLLVVSALLGIATCVIGTALSSRYEQLPDGPFIILTGAALFFASFLFAPRRGIIARVLDAQKFRHELAAGEINLVERKSSLPDELANLPEGAGLVGSLFGAPVPSTGSQPASSRINRLGGEAIHDISALLNEGQKTRPLLSWKIGIILVLSLAGAVVARWWLSLNASEQPLAAWTIGIGCLTNIPCAVFGCFLLLRRRSLLGDAISHSVLPGIAIALLLSGQITGLPIGVSAIVVGILTVLLARGLKSFGRIPEDSSLGIVYATLFAAGVIMFTRVATKADIDPGCLVYGLLDSAALKKIHFLGWEIPSVMPTLASTCLYTFLFVVFLWKELKIATFDSALATAMGFKASIIDYLVLGFVAAAVVAAFEAVGSILVVAMLIVPAATARLLTDRLAPTIGWSIVMAISSAVFGNMAAQHLNTSAAGMMVVVAGVQFLLAVFFAPEHGLVSRWSRKFSLSVRIAAEDVLGMLYRAGESLQHDERLPMQTNLRETRRVARGLVGRLAIRQLRMQHQIYVSADGDLELTDTGRDLAQSIVRSHRLWETYLGAKTELRVDHLHAPAERMEHFIGPELQEQIAAELTVANVDPHGRAIPAERYPLRSLEGLHGTVPVPPAAAGFWQQYRAFVGPALLVSVGYMDPGNWGTDLAGGASYRYDLLWVVAVSSLMAIFLQVLSARLGIVTGKDLAQACRDYYPKWTRFPNWLTCELAIAACDLAEVLGSAVAINLLFHIPMFWAVIITAFDVLLLLALQGLGMRFIEAVIGALVATIGACYFVEIFVLPQTQPNFFEIGRALFTPGFRQEGMLVVAIGIIGATVMPHNLYLHSALVHSRKLEHDESGLRRAIRFNTIDTVGALLAAFLVNGAILVLAALVFYGKSGVQLSGGQYVAFNQNTDWIRDAYLTLAPLLGTGLASILFAVALLASGQSSTITGTLAGQVVMEGFMHWRLPPWLRRVITRSLAIIPAIIIIGIRGDSSVNDLLVLSQVILAMQLPLAMFPLLHFTSSKKWMGRYRSGWLLLMTGWVSAVLITALDLYGLPDALKNAWSVIVGR